MNFILGILLVCFFIFLYVLYFFSRDDFVIVRKDIPMEKIFNMAFLTGLVSLFFSRLFYVIFNPSPALINPLGFLAIPYYPGLSLIGGIISGGIFVCLYARFKKIPIGKIFDIFTMSFICVLPLGFLLTFIVLLAKTSILFNALFFLFIVIFLVFIRLVYPFSIKGEIKDGTLGIIFLSIFSVSYYLIKLFLNIKYFSFVNLENIVVLATLFFSLIILINLEIMDKFLEKK